MDGFQASEAYELADREPDKSVHQSRTPEEEAYHAENNVIIISWAEATFGDDLILYKPAVAQLCEQLARHQAHPQPFPPPSRTSSGSTSPARYDSGLQTASSASSHSDTAARSRYHHFKVVPRSIDGRPIWTYQENAKPGNLDHQDTKPAVAKPSVATPEETSELLRFTFQHKQQPDLSSQHQPSKDVIERAQSTPDIAKVNTPKAASQSIDWLKDDLTPDELQMLKAKIARIQARKEARKASRSEVASVASSVTSREEAEKAVRPALGPTASLVKKAARPASATLALSNTHAYYTHKVNNLAPGLFDAPGTLDNDAISKSRTQNPVTPLSAAQQARHNNDVLLHGARASNSSVAKHHAQAQATANARREGILDHLTASGHYIMRPHEAAYEKSIPSIRAPVRSAKATPAQASASTSSRSTPHYIAPPPQSHCRRGDPGPSTQASRASYARKSQIERQHYQDAVFNPNPQSLATSLHWDSPLPGHARPRASVPSRSQNQHPSEPCLTSEAQQNRDLERMFNRELQRQTDKGKIPEYMLKRLEAHMHHHFHAHNGDRPIIGSATDMPNTVPPGRQILTCQQDWRGKSAFDPEKDRIRRQQWDADLAAVARRMKDLPRAEDQVLEYKIQEWREYQRNKARLAQEKRLVDSANAAYMHCGGLDNEHHAALKAMQAKVNEALQQQQEEIAREKERKRVVREAQEAAAQAQKSGKKRFVGLLKHK